jgi:hypothetical protein
MPLDSINIESDVTKTLRAAWALIDDRSKWITGDPHIVSPDGRHQYCSVGAINAVAPYTTARPLNQACVHQLSLAVPAAHARVHSERDNVVGYNDMIFHDELRGWWMRAIELSVESDAKALVEPA